MHHILYIESIADALRLLDKIGNSKYLSMASTTKVIIFNKIC